MSRARLGAGAAALVLALGIGGPLAGCGDDEDEDVETTITTDAPEIVPEDPGGPPEEPDTDAGGTEAPVVPDDGHEGGGPDPGTEEAEQAEQAPGASGGSSSGEDPVEPPGNGNDDVKSGGVSPPQSFEEFCDENPRACE